MLQRILTPRNGFNSNSAAAVQPMKVLNLTAVTLLLFAGELIAQTPAKPPSANLALARQLNDAFVEVAEKVSPSVVVINVVQRPSAADFSENDEDSDGDAIPRDFRREFRRRMRETPIRGEGSGVILREDGYILTNGHVVEDATKIEVRLQDGQTLKGEIKGIDPQSDLAVIKVDAHGLPAATLADSDKTRVGEFAIAIGAPFSLDYSFTFGHVSAKSRSNIVPGYEGASMDQDFIQTDANINPGNSGGPLVNIEGEVIGINTLIRGLHTGIGFAIPANLAKEVSAQLISQGKFTRAWLGVGISAFRDEPLMRERITQIKDGVVVTSVRPDGPASKSELKGNDIIVAVDGATVSTPQQLRTQIRSKPIGKEVTLDVFRKDKTIQVKVVPEEWVQSTNTLASRRPSEDEVVAGKLGLTVHVLTEELAAQFKVSKIDGLIVTAVDKGMPAGVKDLRPGDIITSVNQTPVANPKQFRQALENTPPGRGVQINFKRADKSHFETLKEGSD
jgi:serine protease Do